MWVLGIESSCDETAAAVVDGDDRVAGNVVFGQDELHAEFGGVVPELASREHMARIGPVVRGALRQAGRPISGMEGIAVTCGPGLIGSLLVGVSFAKSLSYVTGTPLIGVNHLEGHMMAPFVERAPPEFPFVALIVSGGHTSLYLAEAFGRYRCLGKTRDDAAGEAFDKVAKMLGLGYPGGVHIDRLAKNGDPTRVRFPRGMRRKGGCDFSFSGLKTAVMNFLRQHPEDVSLEDLAASFQDAVVDVLAQKTVAAAKAHGVSSVVVSGGVAANSGLRARFAHDCRQAGLSILLPTVRMCTDNAAMIGWVGRQRLLRGERSTLLLGPSARLQLR